MQFSLQILTAKIIRNFIKEFYKREFIRIESAIFKQLSLANLTANNIANFIRYLSRKFFGKFDRQFYNVILM